MKEPFHHEVLSGNVLKTAGRAAPRPWGSKDVSDLDDRTIERRISDAFDELTESERRLAQVVRQTQGGLSSFNAHELAARANVSNATAARLFRRLGYASYGEGKRQARDQQAWASPADEMGGARSSSETGAFLRHIAQDCRNLARTGESLADAALTQAAEILVMARTVHVVGFRNSMALATYARALLVHVKPDVRLFPEAGMTVAEELAGFDVGQALLAIGFRRRPPLLRAIMTVAKHAGVKMILIADDSAAATAKLATVTLRCQNTGAGMFDSYAAAMSVINYLINTAGLLAGEQARDRLLRIEELHVRLGSFREIDVPPRAKRR